MIGIENVGIYIPSIRINNFDKAERFGVTAGFIENKIGVNSVAKKDISQKTSDLCVLAYENLLQREKDLETDEVDFVCVCTQNGDYQLPHSSAIVQGILDLPYNCAAFDVSLGCSGYVYALHIVKSFMEMNDMQCGLLFTCDPYSDILDKNDKNTDFIFGDGATVTLLSNRPVFHIGKGVFGTDGKKYDQIIKRKNDCLFMNGRGVFNFVMKRVPESINQCLTSNDIQIEDVDYFLLHQASQYLLENLVKRAKLDSAKVPVSMREFGNTVSSTIPMMLQGIISDSQKKNILLSGFGVGLSVASTLIKREVV